MEFNKFQNNNIVRLVSVGLLLGGLATVSKSSEDNPQIHIGADHLSTNTFAFLDGTKCVNGVYFDFEAKGLDPRLVPNGGCVRQFLNSDQSNTAKNQNSFPSKTGVINGLPAFANFSSNSILSSLNKTVRNS